MRSDHASVPMRGSRLVGDDSMSITTEFGSRRSLQPARITQDSTTKTRPVLRKTFVARARMREVRVGHAIWPALPVVPGAANRAGRPGRLPPTHNLELALRVWVNDLSKD